MAHLLAADGRAISVGDGMGVPIDLWQVGDTLIQAHRLDIPEDIAPGTYWIQTGVYRLDTLERYHFMQDNQIVGDRLLLTAINIKTK